MKFTSFEAFVPPTVTEIAPLQFTVRLSRLVEVVTIFSPRVFRFFAFPAHLARTVRGRGRISSGVDGEPIAVVVCDALEDRIPVFGRIAFQPSAKAAEKNQARKTQKTSSRWLKYGMKHASA